METMPSEQWLKSIQALQVKGVEFSSSMPMSALASLESEMAGLYRKLRPSLVEVHFQFLEESNLRSPVLTSGMVMDNYGLIITPVVLDKAQVDALVDGIKVYRTDGKNYRAELIAWNAHYGVSLLRAEELRGLAPQFGYGLWMEEGSVTIGLGHPFGLPNSISLGFLTGRQRGIGKARELMQITNPINVGDCGGLLANRHGQVVGMMLTSLSDAARRAEDNLKLYVAEYGNDSLEGAKQAQGISFAIPVEVLFKIFPEHFKQGANASRRIGVLVEEKIHVVELPKQQPSHKWEVVVTALLPDSPAQASGLQAGDVFISLGGLSAGSLQELGVAIHSAKLKTVMVVRRGDALLELPLQFEQ
ncbi:MAG: S1C family serine protease [Planctomycetota bacterium]|jgi:serine protease Do|nr:S1C family serine protease [Planctomycetota bacterium]